MSTRIAPLAACLLLVAATAHADPVAWSKSFDPAAVASQHPAQMQSVVVVAGGDASPARDQAVEALMSAYRVSGRAALVMGAQALGDLSALPDAGIVARAAALPISHVAIVRVFASSDGAAAAVVTVYDKAGASVTSFAATEGAALAAKEASTERASAGISQVTADTITTAKSRARDSVDQARTSFDDTFIWFQDFLVVNQYGAVGGGAIAYQGRSKRVLDPQQFYRAVGRDDLADRYTTRRNVRVGVILGGTALSLAALVYGVTGDSCDYPYDGGAGELDDYYRCEDDSRNRLVWGVGVSMVGTLAATVAWLVPSHPVSLSSRRRLAIDHNARLRSQLGLDSEYMPRLFKARLTDVRITPYAAPGGGGLVLGGRF
jgi:hypothetical protein